MILNYLKTFFFLFLFFIIHVSKGQDTPPIENYSPVTYKAGNQNWAISQSDEKNMYFANNSGLLEFNGASWKLYPTPNGSIMRSVNVINNIIYTGSYMDIGYWDKNDLGNLSYYSLLDKLNTPLIEDEQFWNIIGLDSWVLFQSLDRIYIYNTIDETFTIIESKSTRAKIFVVNNEVYFQKGDEGIFKIEKGVPEFVLNHPILSDYIIVGVFMVDKELVFLTENGSFYKWNNNQLVLWNSVTDKELNQINVYASLALKDGSYILGTISNGIIHIDKRGNIVHRINKEKGLNNNTILSLFADIDGNIWSGLDNGISVINLNSPFRVYNDINGRLGTVYASYIFNGFLYLGTNQGLFYKKIKTEDAFKFIKGTRGQVWSLQEIDHTLFCAHHEGTFVIDKNIAKRIPKTEGTWSLDTLNNNPDFLIQGNYLGLYILEKKKGAWRLRNKIEGIDMSSRTFEVLEDNSILLNHEYKGVFKVALDSDLKKVIRIEKVGQKAFASHIQKYADTIYYIYANTILKYNTTKNTFLIDSTLTNIFYSKDEPVLGRLVTDVKNNKLWGFSAKNIINIQPSKFDRRPHLTKIPIPSFFRKSMGIAGYETINYIDNDLYIIGSAKGYTLLDLNKTHKKDAKIAINAVFKHAVKKEEKQQLPLNGDTELKFKNHNLIFSLSVPDFDKYTAVMYQYKVKGLSDEWSNWTTDSEVYLNKLPFGEYVFEARAKVGNTLTTNVVTYSFTINRPWHLSNLMLLIYLIFIGSVLYLIHFFNKRHFKKQKLELIEKQEQEVVFAKLEAEQELMKVKNEQLKNDIKNKNRELTISSMSIIKKNKFLIRIKKELIDDHSFKKNDRVIKTINDNINSNKDWQFLEEALNNADKDFFKKLKEVHPKLTPNDLRFCAFLRLNLSSKEIAPLLNISVRSVEIKRYRLRKKMELPHEGSLIDHILKI